LLHNRTAIAELSAVFSSGFADMRLPATSFAPALHLALLSPRNMA